MNKGVNKVILIGNCGRDPRVSRTNDNKTITQINIATSKTWKNKQTGATEERTEWHNCNFFDRGNFKLASIAAEILKKGSRVYIEGELSTRTYDKDGEKRYSTSITVNEFQLLTNKSSNDSSQYVPQGNEVPVPQPVPQAKVVNYGSTGQQAYTNTPNDNNNIAHVNQINQRQNIASSEHDSFVQPPDANDPFGMSYSDY